MTVNSVDSYNFFATWISFYDKNKEQLWGISPLFLTIIPVNNPQNAPKIAKENPFILKFKRIDACRYIPWGPTSKKQNTLSVPVKFWPVGPLKQCLFAYAVTDIHKMMDKVWSSWMPDIHKMAHLLKSFTTCVETEPWTRNAGGKTAVIMIFFGKLALK